MAKRLIFSTAAPNNQDSVVPNDKINFTRYNKNPILLKEHRWGTDPLGRMTDIKLINDEWTGIPVFHKKTQESIEAAGMYEADALNGASIGGFAYWKRNPISSELALDAGGNKVAEEFDLYEISLTGLPANENAIGKETFSTKFYDESELQNIDASIVTMSSKFNLTIMPETKPNPAGAPAAHKPAADGAEPTTLATGNDGGEHTTNNTAKGADDLPAVIKAIVKNGGHVTFAAGTPAPVAAAAAPAPKDEPDSEPGDENTGNPNPDPIGMGTASKKALSAQKHYDRTLKKSNDLVDALKAKKDKAEADDAKDEDKEAYTSAHTETVTALKACEAAKVAFEAAKEEADDEEAEYSAKKAAKKNGKAGFSASRGGAEPVNTGGAAQAAAAKPQLKSPEQLAADMKIIAAPSFKAKVGAESQGITFTKLNALNAKEEDKKIVAAMFNTDKKDTVDLRSHAIVANAIMNDPRLRPVVNVARFNSVSSDDQIRDMRRSFNPNVKTGIGMREVANELNSGRIMFKSKIDGNDRDLSLFNSTDNALASPSVTTIEWMSLALYELFPSVSWKAPISLFESQMTGRNTGIIFANVNANPAVYKGNSPAPAADYTYTDQAVALALTPYYLQPMLWNPLYMHQLRYDQMATGWAQGFAKWNSVMDDNLLYTLASTVPAASIIGTSGLSGYNANPQIFNIPASGPGNVFFWNNLFAGNLFNPTLNDIIAIEQVYRNQNFDLERETACLVLDPIGERYIAQDPETKSLLTSFKTTNGEELLKYKHTMLNVRSRVAVYDPATGQVKDINGGIPATSVSAQLGFMPSQVGIGIGKLDVFMQQDSTNYGHRMSADIRIGAVPLHFTFRGTTLYVPQGANI